MDVPEERYKKIINTYRPLLSNVISEYPIPLEAELPLTRNFKYLVEKEKYSNNLPSQFYDDAPDEIKILLNDETPEVRLLGLRLARCLPFTNRVQLIEEAQNVKNYSHRNSACSCPKWKTKFNCRLQT